MISRTYELRLVAAAWLLVFAVHVAVRQTNVGAISIWLLRLLTVVLLVAVVQAVVRFAATRLNAKQREERFFDEQSVKLMLLIGLGVGLVFRATTWGLGDQTILGWIGTGLVGASFAGLIACAARREVRLQGVSSSFYFNPLWKYGLLVICITTLFVQGAVTPSGVLSSFNVALFLLSLVALITQTVGRRSRSHSANA